MSDDAQTAGGGPGDPIPPEARAANLALWNHWTRVHEKSAFYDVEGFKAGATSLWPVEREELGPFVHEGTTLLHLQCHFGLDTLSWARLGAEVVGLDLSDEAIALARRLAGEVGLSGRAEFVCADLYDADAHLGDRRFDVVFVSWGAIEWLPDLDRWAAIIARHLAARRHVLHGRDPPVRLRPGRGARASIDVQVKYRTAAGARPSRTWSPSRAATPTATPTRPASSRTAGSTASPRSPARSSAPACASSTCTSSPPRPRRSGTGWCRTRTAGGGCPDGKGGLRKDLPLSYSLRATRPADGEA